MHGVGGCVDFGGCEKVSEVGVLANGADVKFEAMGSFHLLLYSA